MDIMQTIWQKAQNLGMTIALPEGEEERTVKAAGILLKEKIAKVILIGNPEKIAALAKSSGSDISKATVLDPTNSKYNDDFAKEYHQLRAHKGVTPEQAAETMKNNLFFAAMLVRKGIANGAVGGAVNTTGDVMRAAIQVIGMKPGIKIVSSSFMMVMPTGKVYMYSDPAVVPDPNPEQLASIAVSAADTHKALTGEEPIVAMLSFSTKGSAEHPHIDKVREGLKLAQALRPNLLIDGELQVDAAIVPAVGAKKAPGSQVAGKANVFVFPDLDAGNIAYKITQRLANAKAIGPIVQGLNKPFFDLSRGCSAEDIVDTAAVNAVVSGS